MENNPVQFSHGDKSPVSSSYTTIENEKSKKLPLHKPLKYILLLFPIVLLLVATSIYFFISKHHIKSEVINPDGDREKILFLLDYPLTENTLEQISLISKADNWRIDIIPFSGESLNSKYDLIILFASLSGTDSPSIAKFLQQKDKWKNTPVVLFVRSNKESGMDKLTKLLTDTGIEVISANYCSNNNQTDVELIKIEITKAINVIEGRKKENDRKRIDQFLSLFNSINDYFVNQTRLPQSLSDPVLDPTRIKDPITNKILDYSVRSGQFFKLCTEFDWNFSKYPEEEKYPGLNHNKGQDCYYFNAQTDPLKKYNNKEPVLPVKEEILDQIRLKDFVDLSNAVKGYFRTKSQLPTDFQSITPFIAGAEMKDPETEKLYSYNKVSDTDFDFCTVFSSDSPPFDSSKDIADMYNKKIHKKGLDCKRFIITDYKNFRINDTLQNTSFGNWANFADHTEADEWTSSGTAIKRIDRISTEPKTGYPSWYAIQLTPGDFSLIKSTNVKAVGGKSYELSIWSQTAWNCTDCGIFGLEVYDKNNNNISNISQDCGDYSSEYNMRYQYITTVNTVDYVKSSFNCIMPTNVSYVNIKLGIIKSSGVPWNFDDVWFQITD